MNTVLKNAECGICLSVYTDPTVLPCGHSFCKQCIVNQTCGICRKPFVAPEAVPNYALAAVVEALAEIKQTEDVVQRCKQLMLKKDAVGQTTCLQGLLSARRTMECKTPINELIADYVGLHEGAPADITLNNVVDTSAAIIATLQGKPEDWVDAVGVFTSRFRCLVRARIEKYFVLKGLPAERKMVTVVATLMQTWLSWCPHADAGDFDAVCHAVIMQFHPEQTKRGKSASEFVEWFKEITTEKPSKVWGWESVKSIINELVAELSVTLEAVD